MENIENLVGSVLGGRYEISEKIGTGGMAVVYKAHDNVLDRDVAIKILREAFEAESTVVTNFIKEARSSASLVHPNVVSVYDVCDTDGLNYMVMELVPGETLKQYIKDHPRLPWQEACDYAIQIGQGIGAAHARGIIHRDIKPQNIIMAPGNILKVTDFGIAKAMESEKSVAGGTAMGSVHYISPEQAKGGYTDFRSDIYSLGIVLYEMLAGRVPFDGDTPMSVALMHIEETPISVKCVNIDVPADLDYVTMKAMSRDPADRYQTINELLDDLRAVLADENLPSREEKTVPPPEEDDDTEGTDTGAPYDIKGRGRSTRVKENVKKEIRKKNAERNAVILAVSTMAAIVLIAIGLLMFFFKPFSKTIPDLAGMSVSEAKEAANSKGYRISDEVEYAVSDSVPEDKVAAQWPKAGTEASHVEQIKLVVSLGASGGDIDVPDVEGINIDDAIAAVSELGLKYRLVNEYRDVVEQGNVIRQTPSAGTHLNAEDYVTIHFCIGTGTGSESEGDTVVPSVLGKTIEEAEAALSEAGLTLGSVSNRTFSRPAGTIINQSPASGTQVKTGAPISIVISRGSDEESADSEPKGAFNEKIVATDTSGGVQTTGHQYTVKIPQDAASDKVNVQVVANGVTIHNAIHDKSEEQVAIDIDIEGTVSIQVYIDGAKISDKLVTF